MKYVILDVGSLITKLLYVECIKGEVTVLQQYVVTDFFTEEPNLQHTRVIAHKVREVLDKYEIKESKILFFSSLLKTQSSIRDYELEDDNDTYEKRFLEDDLFGRRYPTNTKIRGYLYYGKFVTENLVKHVGLVTTGDLEFFIDLYEAFKEENLYIQLIEPIDSAITNVSLLNKFTYDNPNRVYVDFGNTITISVITKGILRDLHQLDQISMLAFLSELAFSLDVSVETVSKALAVSGLENLDLLEDLGIRDTVKYRTALNEYFKDVFSLLSADLDNAKATYEITDEDVLFMGGFSDVPGIEILYPGQFHRLRLRDFVEEENISLTNDTDTIIDSIFIPSLSGLLGYLTKRSCNLLPKEKISMSIDSKVIEISKTLVTIGICFCAILSVYVSYQAINYFSGLNYKEGIKTLTSQSISLKNDITVLNGYLDASKSASSYLTKLLDFSKHYSTQQLMIASVDTESYLYANSTSTTNSTSSTETSSSESSSEANATKQKKDEKEESNKTESSSSEEEPIVADTPVVSLGGSSNLIMRGYSINTALISQLHSDLKQFDFVQDSEVVGITRKVLPTLETVYIFEIRIEVTG